MHHGQLPPELRGVKSRMYPSWPFRQEYSMTLPYTTTSLAFFSSKTFLTSQVVPLAGGPEVVAVPAAPVSVKEVPVTVQVIVGAPEARPYTRYSVALGTAAHCSVTAPVEPEATV